VKDFSLNYGILPNYTSQNFLSTGKVELLEEKIYKEGANHYLYFDIPKKDYANAVLLLEILDNPANQRLVQDIPLDFALVRLDEEIALFDKSGSLPIFNRFISVEDTVQIRNLEGGNMQFEVQKYNLDFDPASTPMALVNNQEINLEADSVFSINTNDLMQFKSEGLYFIKKNAGDYYGLSFLVTKKRYPQLSKVYDVIEPLVYITTQEEIAMLQSQGDYKAAKKEMDKLWLRLMSGNKEKARRTIKEYYKRVNMANEMFTSYKAGWKTDMGMVFIIFGSPNQVRYFDEKLVWTYNNHPDFTEINFTFEKTANQFVSEEYSLIRYPEYEQIWYPAIELWRDGKLSY